ncbi:MAG TPA: SMP-30/gluconolactonase/LRE family protein [Planctomycetota bacterium]
MLILLALLSQDPYPLGPDHQEQAGVAKGQVEKFSWKESQVYPGTERDYWIYLPANLDAAREYPVIVFCDGGGVVNPKGQMRGPIVLDNLIHKGEIPPMLGLFINPGNVPPVAGGKGRSTRSYEYDTPDGVYAKFLVDEMLPELAKHAKISPRPEDRAVAGVSSGGICAFSAAWFRPDAFRKVITGIGSFTNIRGGVWFPSAIRKTERKPLRVFLQEGEKDLDNVHGNWPLANHDMAAALAFAGYDHKVAFGVEGHSGKQLGSMLPDVLRWLWRKEEPLPAPVPEVKNDLALSGLVIPGKGWEAVVEDGKFVDAPCADAEGNFYYSDLGAGTGLHKIAPDGTKSVFNAKAVGISGMKFGPDGRLYACVNKEKKVVAIDAKGDVEVLLESIGCNDLVVTHKGHVYVTETGKKQVVLIEAAGKSRVVDVGITAPNGLALSPDHETLAVSDYAGAAAWAFRVETNGDLRGRMPVFPYFDFGPTVESKGDGMTSDVQGRWYVSTQAGVRVYDPNGRPIGLILAPTSAAVTSCALAGDRLYALSQGKIFRRQVNAAGFATKK